MENSNFEWDLKNAKSPDTLVIDNNIQLRGVLEAVEGYLAKCAIPTYPNDEKLVNLSYAIDDLLNDDLNLLEG